MVVTFGQSPIVILMDPWSLLELMLHKVHGSLNIFFRLIKHLCINYFTFQSDIIYLEISNSIRDYVRRSLFSSSSGSCHDSDVMWQEIGRMCCSVCSCPHPGSLDAIPPFRYVPPPWSTWYSCQIPRLGHTYDRFLATSHHYRGKNRKNWTCFFWQRSLIEIEMSR